MEYDHREARNHHSAIYLLRTVTQNHIQLTVIADQKANIVIGISLIIFTVLITEAKQSPITPAIAVMTACAAGAAFLSLLALMPDLPKFKTVQLKPNLLFFSYFSRIQEEEFVDEMMETVLGTTTETFEAMLVDLYRLGRVLKKKYYYLTLSYYIFALGLILSGFCLLYELLL
jgi:hypothetical protein